MSVFLCASLFVYPLEVKFYLRGRVGVKLGTAIAQLPVNVKQMLLMHCLMM